MFEKKVVRFGRFVILLFKKNAGKVLIEQVHETFGLR